MRAGRRPRDDRGETLIELAISVMVMSIAVVALVGGLVTAVMMSDIHRKQAKAGAYVRAFSEAIETAIQGSPSAYVDCATPATYAGTYPNPDAAFTTQIVAVAYWSGSSFSGTCATDSGVQRLTLRVASTDGRAAENLDVVIRKPCRSTVDFPADAPCS